MIGGQPQGERVIPTVQSLQLQLQEADKEHENQRQQWERQRKDEVEGLAATVAQLQADIESIESAYSERLNTLQAEYQQALQQLQTEVAQRDDTIRRLTDCINVSLVDKGKAQQIVNELRLEQIEQQQAALEVEKRQRQAKRK